MGSFALYNASNLVNAAPYSNSGSFNHRFASDTGTLSWAPIPEPSSALAGLLLTTGLLHRRRLDDAGQGRRRTA
jgi:hypothetical protein